MEKMESILGGLVKFKNWEEFEIFLEKMNIDESFSIIEMSLIFAQKEGLFSLEESYVIHKCLNKLKKNEEKNISSNLPSDNINGNTNQ